MRHMRDGIWQLIHLVVLLAIGQTTVNLISMLT